MSLSLSIFLVLPQISLIKYFETIKYWCKYFHISNCFFTMKGWTVKKNILRCFFATGLFYLHEKFQLWQSSPSHFFIKKMAFFIIFVGKIFFLQNIYGFTPVKKILSHLDQKWAQTKQLLSKKFQLPIAMEGCIVQWFWTIWHGILSISGCF